MIVGNTICRAPTNKLSGAAERGGTTFSSTSPLTRRTTPTRKTPIVPMSAHPLHEFVGGDDGRKVVVDALECNLFLLERRGAGGVPDHDGQQSVVAGIADVSFDAPVQMNTGEDDNFDAFAGELEWQVGANERGLVSALVQFVIAGADLGTQFVNEGVVPLLLLLGERAVRGEGVKLGAIELSLRVVITKQRVAHPVEGNEVLGLAGCLEYLQRRGQTAALIVAFGGLHATGAVERVRLANRDKGGQASEDFAEVEALPVRGELRDEVQVIGLVRCAGLRGRCGVRGRRGGLRGFGRGSHSGAFRWERGSRVLKKKRRICSATHAVNWFTTAWGSVVTTVFMPSCAYARLV